MTAIDYKTIQSNAYDNIYSILNTRTNVKDPRSVTNTNNRTFVHNSDPEDKALDFNEYPYIVLLFATVMKDKPTNDGKVMEVSWTQRMIIRCARDGSSNSVRNIGRTDFLNICDDLHQTFTDLTIRQTLTDNNIRNVKINQITNTQVSINDITVYESEYELTFKTRLTVSA